MSPHGRKPSYRRQLEGWNVAVKTKGWSNDIRLSSCRIQCKGDQVMWARFGFTAYSAWKCGTRSLYSTEQQSQLRTSASNPKAYHLATDSSYRPVEVITVRTPPHLVFVLAEVSLEGPCNMRGESAYRFFCLETSLTCGPAVQFAALGRNPY